MNQNHKNKPERPPLRHSWVDPEFFDKGNGWAAVAVILMAIVLALMLFIMTHCPTA